MVRCTKVVEVYGRVVWLVLVQPMVFVVMLIVVVGVVVEIVLDEMITIVIWGEEIVCVVARRVLFVVLVNVVIAWDISHGGLVTVNHCGEPVHEEVCDSIVTHR